MRRDPSAWVYREYQIACDTPEDSRMPPTATVEGILKGSNTFISSVARTPPQRETRRGDRAHSRDTNTSTSAHPRDSRVRGAVPPRAAEPSGASRVSDPRARRSAEPETDASRAIDLKHAESLQHMPPLRRRNALRLPCDRPTDRRAGQALRASHLSHESTEARRSLAPSL